MSVSKEEAERLATLAVAVHPALAAHEAAFAQHLTGLVSMNTARVADGLVLFAACTRDEVARDVLRRIIEGVIADAPRRVEADLDALEAPSEERPRWVTRTLEDLLEGKADAPAPASIYRGQASLDTLARVAFARAWQRAMPRPNEESLFEDALTRGPRVAARTVRAVAELGTFRRKHEGAFRSMCAALRETLAGRSLALLMLSLCDELTPTEIAALYAVHPNVVARWLVALRDPVESAVRGALDDADIGLSEPERERVVDAFLRQLTRSLDAVSVVGAPAASGADSPEKSEEDAPESAPPTSS
jgi:hypothetical protein